LRINWSFQRIQGIDQLKEHIANLWPTLVAVGLAFAIGLQTGFILHQKYPALSDLELGSIVAGIIVGATFAILISLELILELAGFRPPSVHDFLRRCAAKLDPKAWARKQAAKENSLRVYATYKEVTRRRIAQLTADPAKHRYIALVEKGEWWSDEQIAYHENRELTATCPHLQSVEHAMRMEGIELRRLGESWEPVPLAKVRGNCRINETTLYQRFPLPESVVYRTGYQPERAEHDNPWADLMCITCDSKIELVHPEWPQPATKWFPSNPA
jgi:hypothetical protein